MGIKPQTEEIIEQSNEMYIVTEPLQITDEKFRSVYGNVTNKEWLRYEATRYVKLGHNVEIELEVISDKAGKVIDVMTLLVSRLKTNKTTDLTKDSIKIKCK